MEEKILEFICRKLLPKRKTIGARDSLFGAGVLDSVGHLQLISFLEKEFSVSFHLAEFTWENFDSVEQIAQLVRQKIANGNTPQKGSSSRG